MDWIKLTESLRCACGGGADAAVPSRREVLAGLGCAGVFVAAESTILAPSLAEAQVNSRVAEPETAPADTGKPEVAECNLPEGALADADTGDVTDVSAQWRRRYWRRHYWRRRYWRRPLWRRRFWRRRRFGVVCRRRWFRGRLVRVCRRVWW
jgi:hypothetical protein